jgi:hypothetical protein
MTPAFCVTVADPAWQQLDWAPLRYAATSSMVVTGSWCRRAKATTSVRRAMLPSGLVSSQITP